MSKIFYLFIFLGFFCLVCIECKIGRGGGGSFRSMGSRLSNRWRPNPRPNPYHYNNRKSGIRWGSFGAGMAAYGIMSSLTHRSNFHQGYYARPGYYHHQAERGSLCVNNEDFNGTKFGSFYCPLPGFNPSAKYCCGSYEAQYCCEYFDDDGRKNGLILAIICVIGILVCLVGCVTRFYLSYKKNSFPKSPSTYANARQFHHINRNIPSQMGNQMRPAMTNRAPNMKKNNQYSAQSFVPQQPSTAPYPTQPLMPQPTNVGKNEINPPCYTQVVQN